METSNQHEPSSRSHELGGMSGVGKRWRVGDGGYMVEEAETGASLFATPERGITVSVVADHNARLDARQAPAPSLTDDDARRFLAAYPEIDGLDDVIAALLRARAERDEARALVAHFVDQAEYSDSYGVPGSNFSCCYYCQGGGAPGVAMVHSHDCPVSKARTAATQWWDEQHEQTAEIEEANARATAAEAALATAKNAIEQAKRSICKWTAKNAIEQAKRSICKWCAAGDPMSLDEDGVNRHGEYHSFAGGNRKCEAVFLQKLCPSPKGQPLRTWAGDTFHPLTPPAEAEGGRQDG